MTETISKEQAKVIATTITPDIKSYINAHHDEYKKFLINSQVSQEVYIDVEFDLKGGQKPC